MKGNDSTDEKNDIHAAEKYYIPEEYLTFVVIIQSLLIGLLTFLIGETYSKNNTLLSFALQAIVCPLIIATTLYIGFKKAKLQTNKRQIKRTLIIFGIIIGALLLLCIIVFICSLILGYLIKSGHKGGGNPWL